MYHLELLFLIASLGYGHILETPPPSSSLSLLPRAGAGGYDSKVVHIDVNDPEHHTDFFRFVTRPDIDAPRWNIKRHDESAIAPGYWFLAPYTNPEQHDRGGGWVGPHIYDQTGELIWSGVALLKGFDAFDFRMSHVRGEDKLSMVYQHDAGLLVNSQYEIERKFDVIGQGQLNMHDFHFAENGTSVLMLKTITESASEEALDLAGMDFGCRARFYGFEEHNLTTGELLFDWSSADHIGLEETMTEFPKKKVCGNPGGYDYIHANAIDKLPDGDYILSGRHCNTIYKISAKDGSIVWRFGGQNSDFKWDGHFTGQHHVSVQSQNKTHTVLSFLDNAYLPKGNPKYSNEMSRGFLVALRTDKARKTAHTVAQFDHPQGDYAMGRGSYQVLPNGNTFVGWTAFALHSEYDVNGKLILEASLRPELKTYRSYKYPWVGHPTEPIAVHSVGVSTRNNTAVTTSVHVSWNGATEVTSWRLYRTKLDGSSKQFLAEAQRAGFETGITYHGYAGNVVVEALDKDGKVLGTSDVVKSIPPEDIYNPAVVEEDGWQQQKQASSFFASSSAPAWRMSTGNFGLAFAIGFVCAAVLSAIGFVVWRSRARFHGPARWTRDVTAYEKVVERDAEDAEDTLVGDEVREMEKKGDAEGRYDDVGLGV